QHETVIPFGTSLLAIDNLRGALLSDELHADGTIVGLEGQCERVPTLAPHDDGYRVYALSARQGAIWDWVVERQDPEALQQRGRLVSCWRLHEALDAANAAERERTVRQGVESWHLRRAVPRQFSGEKRLPVTDDPLELSRIDQI